MRKLLEIGARELPTMSSSWFQKRP